MTDNGMIDEEKDAILLAFLKQPDPDGDGVTAMDYDMYLPPEEEEKYNTLKDWVKTKKN